MQNNIVLEAMVYLQQAFLKGKTSNWRAGTNILVKQYQSVTYFGAFADLGCTGFGRGPDRTLVTRSPAYQVQQPSKSKMQ